MPPFSQAAQDARNKPYFDAYFAAHPASKTPAAAGTVIGGTEPLPLPPPGFIRVRAIAHNDIGLVAELDGPVTVPTGYGSHDVIERPQGVGITSYHGRPPLSLSIPLIFDRWTDQKSIEAEITMVETLLGIGMSRSPQIIIEGVGVPHSYSRDASLRWVLTGDPAWGDDVRFRPGGGHRVFAQVVVTALQVNQATTISEPEPTKGSRKPPAKTYTVTYKGPVNTAPKTSLSNLRKIAKHFRVSLKHVQYLNPKVKDPDVTLKAGTKVRVK